MKITGLDKLQKNVKEAHRALSELDGELGVVSFDAHDPASIEAAIQSVNRMVDQRLGEFSANPIIRPLADQMKENHRERILQKAAEARLKASKDQ